MPVDNSQPIIIGRNIWLDLILIYVIIIVIFGDADIVTKMPFKMRGKIIYDPVRPGMKTRTEWWCIASVDREITRYFRWMIRKNLLNPLDIGLEGSLKKYPHIDLCQPAWDAHVSVIRGAGDWGPTRKPQDWQKALWRKYNGQTFEIGYDLNVKMIPNKPDFWIVEVDAPELLDIRRELNLRTTWPLHLTTGRTYLFGDTDED